MSSWAHGKPFKSDKNSEKRVTTKSDNYLPKGEMKIVQLIPPLIVGEPLFDWSNLFWITPQPPQLPFILKRDQSENKTSTMGY